MKKLVSTIISLLFTMLIQAQVSKNIFITAGGLSTGVTSEELNTVTNLTHTGTIDACDFKTMRDDLPLMAELDISGTTVEAYSGCDAGSNNYYNLANAIPDNAFFNWISKIGKISLTSVLPPSTITSIGRSAFSGCIGLTSFTIPSSVTSISDVAFGGCIGFTSISIPTSVISLGGRAFDSCVGLTSITIPSSITSIKGSTFENCTGLISVTIPISITSINGMAFYRCSSLTSIYTYTANPVDLSSSWGAFEYVDKTTCVLHVSYGSSSLYGSANQWQDFTNIVEMPGFRLSSTSASFPAAGSAIPVAVTANVTWVASSDQSWLTVNPTSYTGNTTLTLNSEVSKLEKRINPKEYDLININNYLLKHLNLSI